MASTTQSVPAGWLPIWQYRDFWDVPRMFLVETEGKLFLFDCPFDEEREDFSTTYQIYQVPAISEAELEGSWAELPNRAIRSLGVVSVSSVTFDPSRRTAIDGRILATPMPSVRTANVSLVDSSVRA